MGLKKEIMHITVTTPGFSLSLSVVAGKRQRLEVLDGLSQIDNEVRCGSHLGQDARKAIFKTKRF